jgi:hypothetical protein
MRAQSYVADRLTKEGWFDAKDPWVVDDPLDEDRAWLPKTGPDGKRVDATIPAWDGYTAQDAWREAADRWRKHGTDNALRMDPARLQQYVAKAEEFNRIRPGLDVAMPTPALTADEQADPHIADIHHAHEVLTAFITNRNMTNYETFELEADAMQTDDAMLAKKRFRQADKAVREAAQYSEAVRLYDEGFAAWQRVMLGHQDCRTRKAAEPSSRAAQACRDFRDLDRAQEDVYELNMRYVKLARDVNQGRLRTATQLLNDMVFHLGAGATSGNPFQFACDTVVLAADVERPGAAGSPTRLEARAPQLKAVMALPLPGPMDGLAPDGTPWVNDQVKRRVKERLGIIKPQSMGPQGGPGPMGPPQDPRSLR